MSVIEFKTTPFNPLRAAPPTAVETALTANLTTGGGVIVLAAPTDMLEVEGTRGARMQFVSNGANNETMTWALYGIDRYRLGPTVDAPDSWHIVPLGGLAITLGTKTWVAGSLQYATSYLFADTCVWTASTYGTARLTYCGGNAAAFSPADNTIAEFLISDFGNCSHIAMLATTYGLTATSAANVLVKLDT